MSNHVSKLNTIVISKEILSQVHSFERQGCMLVINCKNGMRVRGPNALGFLGVYKYGDIDIDEGDLDPAKLNTLLA